MYKKKKKKKKFKVVIIQYIFVQIGYLKNQVPCEMIFSKILTGKLKKCYLLYLKLNYKLFLLADFFFFFYLILRCKKSVNKSYFSYYRFIIIIIFLF
jgi:hypothetical protein